MKFMYSAMIFIAVFLVGTSIGLNITKPCGDLENPSLEMLKPGLDGLQEIIINQLDNLQGQLNLTQDIISVPHFFDVLIADDQLPHDFNQDGNKWLKVTFVLSDYYMKLQNLQRSICMLCEGVHDLHDFLCKLRTGPQYRSTLCGLNVLLYHRFSIDVSTELKKHIQTHKIHRIHSKGKDEEQKEEKLKRAAYILMKGLYKILQHLTSITIIKK